MSVDKISPVPAPVSECANSDAAAGTANDAGQFAALLLLLLPLGQDGINTVPSENSQTPNDSPAVIDDCPPPGNAGQPEERSSIATAGAETSLGNENAAAMLLIANALGQSGKELRIESSAAGNPGKAMTLSVQAQPELAIKNAADLVEKGDDATVKAPKQHDPMITAPGSEAAAEQTTGVLPTGIFDYEVSSAGVDGIEKNSSVTKLNNQFSSDTEQDHQTPVAPAQPNREHDLAGADNLRQKFAGARGDSWPGGSENKNQNAERQFNSTAFALEPNPQRQELHSRIDGTAGAWRPTVDRLAGEIAGRLHIGERGAVIQLDPPELGKIKIDLRMEGDKLHARIVAEAHDAQALLENHLTELRQSLQSRGIDLADVRVSQGGWSGTSDPGHGFHHTPQGRPQSGSNFGSSGAPSENADLPPPAQPIALDGGRVSIRV